MPDPDPERVILVPGLWMPGASLGVLARRLRAQGWQTETFVHARMGLDAAVTALRQRLRQVPEPTVHLVGHSLGGLIAVRATAEPDLPPGRIVCLGSPLAGSAAARRLCSWPATHAWLGDRERLLCEGLCAQPRRECGVIAGCQPIGLGAWLAALPRPHDGTVAVSETRIDGLVDHCVIATSHTGLLWSDQAARAAACFLRRGTFDRARAAGAADRLSRPR